MRITRYEGNEIIKTTDQQIEQQLTIENFDLLMRKCVDTMVLSGLRGSELSSPGMSVDITSGSVWDSTLKQYIMIEDDFTVNISPSDPSLSRYDIIQIRREIFEYDLDLRSFKDESLGSILNYSINTKQQYTMDVSVKEGSPGGSAPPVDAGYVKIMEIEVPASAVAIYDANIKNITAMRVGDSNAEWTADLTSIIYAGSPSDVNGLIVSLYEDPVSLNGIKTFNSIPVFPASNPTSANQAARKQYVDTLGGGSSVSPTVTGGIDLLSYLTGLNVFPDHSSSITLTFTNIVNSGRKLLLYNGKSDYYDAVVEGITYRLNQEDCAVFVSNGTSMVLSYFRSQGIVSIPGTIGYTISKYETNTIIDLSGISSPGQIVTFTKGTGATRRNKVEVYNGSAESVEITDGINSYALLPDETAVFYFQGADLVQQAFGGGSGGGAFDVGDIIFSSSLTEKDQFQFCNYGLLEQSIYAELFSKYGHCFAKNSSDAGAAESAGKFHKPDGRLLFPRGGETFSINNSNFTAASANVTVSSHGFASDGSDNGRPIKLVRVPGSSPTMPEASGYAEYNQMYIHYVDADTLNFYTTEAYAIAGGATGLLTWTTVGSGSFYLTTIGCYQASAIQSHWHDFWYEPSNTGPTAGNPDMWDRTNTGGHDDNVREPIDGSMGSVTVSNESRPSFVSLGMQIKVIGTSISTGEGYDSLATEVDLGAQANFTNVSILVTHNLGVPSRMITKNLEISSDGINWIEPGDTEWNYTSPYGFRYRPNDDNSFYFDVGATGIAVINPAGTGISFGDGTYVRFFLSAPNLFAKTYVSGDLTIYDSTAHEITENTNGNVLTLDSSITTQKTITLSKGSLASISNRVKIYNKSGYSGYHIITDGSTTYWLEPGQTTEFFFDGSALSRGPGDQLITATPVYPLTLAVPNGEYKFRRQNGTASGFIGHIYVDSSITTCYGDWGGGSANVAYTTATGQWTDTIYSYNFTHIWKVYK